MNPTVRMVLVTTGVVILVILGVSLALFVAGLSTGAVREAWMWGITPSSRPAPTSCVFCPAPQPAPAQFYCCQVTPAPQVIFRQPKPRRRVVQTQPVEVAMPPSADPNNCCGAPPIIIYQQQGGVSKVAMPPSDPPE